MTDVMGDIGGAIQGAILNHVKVHDDDETKVAGSGSATAAIVEIVEEWLSKTSTVESESSRWTPVDDVMWVHIDQPGQRRQHMQLSVADGLLLVEVESGTAMVVVSGGPTAFAVLDGVEIETHTRAWIQPLPAST